MNVRELRYATSGDIVVPDVRAAFLATGVVLLRLDDADPDFFERLSHSFCDSFHEVGTRQVLRREIGDGYTTEVFRDNFILLGHAEGTYRPYPPPPELCFFMCLTAPVAAGGETTLIDGAAMLAALPKSLRQRLEEQGIIYECRWERARWQAEFEVPDESSLLALLAELPTVRYRMETGCLFLQMRVPAITRARDGTAVFANGVLAHLPKIPHPRYAGLPVYAKDSNKVYFGDGEALDDAAINTLIDAHDAVLYRHRWQTNDILLVDNTRYMHGREMTAVACERVLISRFGRLAGNVGVE